MAAKPIQGPSENPPSTPLIIPSENLLKDFRATLEQRWNEFDKATIQEAIDQNPFGKIGAQSLRDADANFIKAKEAFDQAKKMLSSIQTDAELKSNNEVLSTVEATLKTITDHLKKIKPDEKSKAINIVLTKTSADLSKFKADITGNVEDKKSAEEAKDTVTTVLAEAGGGTLASEAVDDLSNAVGEGVDDMKKEVGEIKKNPIKKIAEFLGFNESGIASSIKEALAEKKSGGIDGFFATIKIWFYGLMAKITGVDLSSSLTPEEMKLAGIKGKVAEKVESNETPTIKPKEVSGKLENIIIKSTSGHFIKRSQGKSYDDFWSALYSGVKDATWGSNEKEKKKKVENRAIDILGWVPEKKVSDILALKDNKDPNSVLQLKNLDSIDKEALKVAIFSLCFNEKYIQDIIGQKYPNWRDMKMAEFLKNYYEYTGIASLDKVITTIKGINLSDSDISDKIKSLAISIDPKSGKLGGLVGEKLESLKSVGINEEVVNRLIVPGTEGETSVIAYRTTLDNKEYTDPNAQNFLSKLTDKKEGFQNSVTSLMIELGLENYVSSLDNGDSIHMQELLMVYVVTGGKTKMDDLTQAQQNELIPILYGIVARKNPGTFAVNSFVDLIGKANDNKYFIRMKKFVGDSVSDATYISVFTTLGLVGSSAEAFLELRNDPDKSWIFYTGVSSIALSLVGAFYLRKPILTVTLAGTILTGLATLGGITTVTAK